MKSLIQHLNEAVADTAICFNEAVKQPQEVGMNQDDLYNMIDKNVKDNTTSDIVGRNSRPKDNDDDDDSDNTVDERLGGEINIAWNTSTKTYDYYEMPKWSLQTATLIIPTLHKLFGKKLLNDDFAEAVDSAYSAIIAGNSKLTDDEQEIILYVQRVLPHDRNEKIVYQDLNYSNLFAVYYHGYSSFDRHKSA